MREKVNKKIIVIGAGISGLAISSLLQQSGYEVLCIEQHKIPGGLCTSWKRQNFKIDLCIHWLYESGANNVLNDIYRKVFNFKKLEFIYHDFFYKVNDGKNEIIFYSDLYQLKEELLSKCNEDSKIINEFIDDLLEIDPFINLSKLYKLYKYRAYSKETKNQSLIFKYLNISGKDFAEKFKNPLLKKGILRLFDEEYSMLFSVMTLKSYHERRAGYPIGGSLHLSINAYTKLLKFGGKVQFATEINEILIRDNKAIGIGTKGGKKLYADYVISSIDGNITYNKLIDNQDVRNNMAAVYSKLKAHPSLFYLSIGVGEIGISKKDNYSLVLVLDEEIIIDKNFAIKDLLIRIHIDKTFTKQDKSIISVIIEVDNLISEEWIKLKEHNINEYNNKKKILIKQILPVLKKKLKINDIELIDLSTPSSVFHYTKNKHGCFHGWKLTPSSYKLHIPYMHNEIQNFYHCGHWTTIGGGIPGAVLTANRVYENIIRESKF